MFFSSIFKYLRNFSCFLMDLVASFSCCFVALCSCFLMDLVAQEVTQTIQLKPGWNSIYLEVQPKQDSWQDIFEGIDTLDSVWSWNPKTSMVEFITSPNELKPHLDQWPAYLPNEAPLLTNLFTAVGGKAYLVKMQGTQSVTLQIKGKPVSPSFTWKSDSFNFVGFSLEQGAEPFFETFFESSPAHRGQAIYQLSDVGEWKQVEYPATTQMKSGEGFWVYSSGPSYFSGLLEVELEQGYDLSYGSSLLEQKIELSSQLENVSVFIQQKGDALLQYYNSEKSRFEPLSNTSIMLQTDTNKTLSLRLAVDRSAIDIDSVQGGILEIKDSQGSLIQIPYSATKSNASGIWIGFVEIDNVEDSLGDLKPTASPFQFRLILEIDETGKAKLLREFKNPSTGQRVSSVVFNFNNPQSMTGNFSDVLRTTIVINPEHATHPYKHKYHPDHDNLTPRFKALEVGQVEVFEVIRNITLEFQSRPVGSSEIPLGWGDRIFGGIYKETVQGVHKKPIQIQGNFWIQKVGE